MRICTSPGGEFDLTQEVRTDVDALGVGENVVRPDHVDIPLEELSQAALLRILSPAEPRNREPLDRARQRVDLRVDHACQRRSDFRANRQIPPAAIGEIEKLLGDFFAALSGEQVQILEDRRVVFLEPVAQRD